VTTIDRRMSWLAFVQLASIVIINRCQLYTYRSALIYTPWVTKHATLY